MGNIKSFLYLDEYKMYSFSSQMFRGLTESLVEYTGSESVEQEQQKGPINSGKIMSDIIKRSDGKEEKKYLHDYAYLLFEKKLEEDQKITNIMQDNYSNSISEKNTFIKAKGKIKFNDFKKLAHTLKEFNKIGSALMYLSSFSIQQEMSDEIENSVRGIKDRNQKASNKTKIEMTMKAKIRAEAEKIGLHLNDDFLKEMVYILDYGFDDLFLIEMPIQCSNKKIILSSFLNRQYLREDENLLISKYSRITEKEIVITGILTQSMYRNNKEAFTLNCDQENANIKSALSTVTDKLADIEDNFIGKMKDEIILDPIALYLEI